jgi:3-hydroxyacyl-CoA dehydrogenase
MANPTVFMLKIFTGGLSVPVLRAAVASLTKWWGVLKRRAVMQGITMLAGMMEVVPVTIGRRLVWCIHLHAIADVVPAVFDLAAVQKAWKDITGRKSSFVGTQELISKDGYLRYMSKMRDRCPWPGALRPAWLLKVLVRAMKGAHGWFEWGLPLTKRGRASKKKAVTATTFIAPPTAESSEEYDRDEDDWSDADRPTPTKSWRWVIRAERRAPDRDRVSP